MTFRFVVDNLSLVVGNPNTGFDRINAVLDCIETATDAGHDVIYDEGLFDQHVSTNLTFWELCDSSLPIHIPVEIQQRAAATFGRLSKWHENCDDWPDDFDVTVNGGAAEESPGLAWAVSQSTSPKDAVSCISNPSTRSVGSALVTTGTKSRSLFFIQQTSDFKASFRWNLTNYADDPSDFAALSEYAFTDLLFVDRCFDGIKSMAKSCRILAPDLVHHLAMIDDHGRRVFSGSWQNAPAEFGSVGVNLSDENGNTKNNQKARRARTLAYDNSNLTFWWHTKLEPHQNRIHFYPDKIPNGGRIIVGIFCLHLTT